MKLNAEIPNGSLHLPAARLVALGLGEAPADREANHLAGCPACAGAVHADARLWQQVRQLPQPEPPVSLASGALARYRQARAQRRPRRDFVLPTVALLALELVLCFAVWQLFPGVVATAVLALPRWLGGIATALTLTKVFAAALPVLALSAAVLLAAVVLMLRRLSSAPLVK